MKKKWLFLLIPAGFLLLLGIVCLLIRPGLAKTQLSQYAAERWAGDSGLPFRQVSCFFTRDNVKGLEEIYELRQRCSDRFLTDDLETPEGGSLYLDAWSTTGSVTVYSEHGSVSTGVVAVGGSFFDFHPLPLRSGSYLRQEDLMKDRVILDENLAWMLFGSVNVAGMGVEIGGLPYVIAGVVAREDDKATSKFAEDGPVLYLPYEAWQSMGHSGVDCYEAVLPEPVDGYAETLLETYFPVGNGILQVNSGRFRFSASWQQMRAFGTRGAQTSAVILPYWENAARYVEDWCALLAFLALLFFIVPALCAVAAIAVGWVFGRKALYKGLPKLFRRIGDWLYSLSSRAHNRTHKQERV